MDTIQGYIDRITGLYDFNYFKYHYNEFITYHKNSKVVAFDLTDFKVINDTHGHQVGDYCLRKFGECVLEVFPDDLFVRRSGDEFYLLTDKDENEIARLLHKLDRIIKDNNTINEQMGETTNCKIDFDAGISYAEHSIEVSLDKADAMLMDTKAKRKKDALNPKFQFFSEEIYQNFKASDIFVSSVKNEIQSKKITYASRELCDLDQNTTSTLDVYTRNSSGQSIFEGSKLELLKKSYVLKQLDYKNLRKFVLDSTQIKGSSLMLNIHSQSLISKEGDFDKFIVAICDIAKNDITSFILCINIDSLGKITNEDWKQIIKYIDLLKRLGFKICLGSYNTEIVNPAINIWLKTNVDYMKISRDAWESSQIDEKNKSHLQTVTSQLVDSGTTPIFMKIENPSEIEIASSINHNSLYIGNARGAEKVLNLKPIKNDRI